MTRSTTLLLLLLACADPPGEPPAAPAAVTLGRDGAEQAEAIRAAVAAWRRTPGRPLQAAVLQACDRGLAVADPSPELDLALGDALANVLLRPDLGLARLEPHVAHPAPEIRDAWLDALLRSGDLARLASEHERLLGQPLDVEHPTAQAVGAQAALDASVRWTDLRDGVAAARLVESALALSRLSFDRPVESVGAAFETLAILLEGWTIEVVGARTLVPADGDPLVTPGLVSAADGRRVVLGHAIGESPADVREPGTQLDLRGGTRLMTLAARGHRPGGGEPILVAAEATRRNGTTWLTSTNDQVRLALWMEATEMLLELRAEGVGEAEAARRVRERFQQRFLSR